MCKFPEHDIILSLKEMPFLRRNDGEKRDVLNNSKPNPALKGLMKDRRSGR